MIIIFIYKLSCFKFLFFIGLKLQLKLQACGQEKSSSCFSKYKAMGQCFENIRNKSADWKNLSDKRKQIATECVAKNKK